MLTIHKTPVTIFFLLVILITACDKQNKSKSEQNKASITESEPTQKTISNDFKNNLTSALGNEVLSILQDRENNYWFGANDGVYRYNGTSLIRFTTKDGLFQNQVQKIQEDESGNIWFTTGGYGVNCFNGQTISTLTVKENVLQNNSSETNWKTEQGDLWFNAGGGAFRYYNHSFTYFPFPQPNKSLSNPPYQVSTYGVYSILKDRNGNLWFGTQSMGVCRFDGKSFTWFTEKGLKGPAVLALFEDRTGVLWFGNNGKGLFRYDGKTLNNITEEKGLGNPEFIKSGKQGPGTLARVWSLNEDHYGNLFIGTGDAGVWRYNGQNLIHYTTRYGKCMTY